MNERIKLLAREAGLLAHNPDGPPTKLEKFAELIVRECVDAIIKDSRLNDVRSAANGCVRTIREHFGVEE